MPLCKTATFLLEGIVFSPLESTESLCVKTVLLVLPKLFTSSETLCALRFVPPLPLSVECLLHGTPVGVVEGEWAGRCEADVKVLVADLIDSGIGVVGDVNALESQEEDLCETDVVERVRDLYLVLERLGGRVGVGGGRHGAGRVARASSGPSTFLGSLSSECDGGYVRGSATAVHLGRGETAESCREHGRRQVQSCPIVK